MNLNSGGILTQMEVTEAVIEDQPSLDSNSRAGVKRISMEIKAMLGAGHSQ